MARGDCWRVRSVHETVIEQSFLSANFIWKKNDLDQWITRLTSDSTLIVAIATHQDVSSISPFSTPGILHDVIGNLLLRTIRSIADSQHAVIEISGRTVRLVVDTFVIELKRLLRSIDTDGDRANCSNG